jgi:Flp pilus assembly protein TadD
MAWILNQAKDPAAREYAERAYRIAPFNYNVMDTLGWTLVNGNDLARGTQILRMASNMVPGDPEIRLHLGIAQARGGDKASARTTLEPLTRLDAKSPVRAEAEKTLSTL